MWRGCPALLFASLNSLYINTAAIKQRLSLFINDTEAVTPFSWSKFAYLLKRRHVWLMASVSHVDVGKKGKKKNKNGALITLWSRYAELILEHTCGVRAHFSRTPCVNMTSHFRTKQPPVCKSKSGGLCRGLRCGNAGFPPLDSKWGGGE